MRLFPYLAAICACLWRAITERWSRRPGPQLISDVISSHDPERSTPNCKSTMTEPERASAPPTRP